MKALENLESAEAVQRRRRRERPFVRKTGAADTQHTVIRVSRVTQPVVQQPADGRGGGRGRGGQGAGQGRGRRTGA